MTTGITGHTARILHTPGHTQGSICLHFAPENLLLAGDTLFAGRSAEPICLAATEGKSFGRCTIDC